MSRILLIPHAPATPLRTRSGELARALSAQGHTVEIYAQNLQPKGLRPAGKLAWHLAELLGGAATETLPDGVSAIRLPTIHVGLPLRLLAYRLASGVLDRREYDLIVNSSEFGLAPAKGRHARLVYDLVDDHPAGWRHAGREGVARLVERYVSRRMAEADVVTASSLTLVELARAKYGREARLVPNGANVAPIRKAAAGAPSPKIHVGYVGGLEKFVRIDWVVGAIEKLRRNGIPAELTVAGDGPAIRGANFPDWVRLAGFLAPAAIPAFLATFQVGVVPFELSPFTHAALPLKVLEYGAAGRLCVSSPLEELKRQNLPWVSFAEGDGWADALERAIGARWNAAWDAEVDRFDWSAGARKLVQVALSGVGSG